MGGHATARPLGVDCGTAGTVGDPATSTYAKVTRHGDDLYVFVHVRDEFQSYAVKPAECVAHWLADSVEILIDPRGNSSQTNMDTASTFKLGVFPFTNDPTGSNGNGANGPCWSRDADNHQGYSTGPLADTVADAPNAPGVEVASSADVGRHERDARPTTRTPAAATTSRSRSRWRSCPPPSTRTRMGLNITPYDNDNNAGGGHDDAAPHRRGQSRLSWSAFGSVQSNPYLWGHATLAGYTPPADRPTTPRAAEGRDPAQRRRLAADDRPVGARRRADLRPRPGAAGQPAHEVRTSTLERAAAAIELTRQRAAAARAIFLWSGEKGYIPVWTTSCSPAADPPPDYGLTPCALTDGGVAAVVARHERARRPRRRGRRGPARQADPDPARRGGARARSRATARR